MNDILRYEMNSHQARVMESEKEMIFLGGGVGCGKTEVGSLWTVKKVNQMLPGQLGLITANTYGQLRISTLRNLYKNLRKWSCPVRPSEIPKKQGGFSIYVLNDKGLWCEIVCWSLDAYEALSGSEIPWAWLDETWQTTKVAIDTVQARLRDDSHGLPPQMLNTTTLDDPESYMYKLWVDNYSDQLMDVVYATTYDNQHNLPKGYIQRLKTTYDPTMFERMVCAKWISIRTDRIYRNFDRILHVSDRAEFDPHLPILWALDFNIGVGKPMSSCMCQIKRAVGKNGIVRPELHVFDEIVLETSDTNDAIKEFQERKWNARKVVVYGDAAGRSRDTRSKQTDYTILAKAGFRNQKVPKANPPIRDRHNAVNAMLMNANGDIRLFVHPRCKTVAKGLETTKLKKGGQYLEEETYSQHITTALGYLVNVEFPINRTILRQRSM